MSLFFSLEKINLTLKQLTKIYMTINALLYGGFFLIITGFIIFIIWQIHLRKIEIEQFKQEQLHKAFMKARKIKK